MANVSELRVALTVEDFGRALAFYRDALGLLRAHRRPVITQVAYQGQNQPASPQLHQER